MFTQWALRPDSGGPGRHRGGLGAIYEIEALAEDGADVFLFGERGKYPPFGVNGGKAAALNRFVYETDGGEATPPLVSKVTDIKIRRGQKVRLETPGGGGFGDPLEREPERVVRDVRLGYVSRRSGARATTRSCCATTGRSTPTRLRQRAGGHRHERAGVRSSASMSAGPSPTCFCSIRRQAHSAPPRCRRVAATRRRASSTACARSAASSAIGSIVHGTTVGTNTLLERRGPKIGVITTRGFRDVLEMRRRDRPAHLGPVGRLHPDRRPRHARRGRRAHARRRHASALRSIPTRCAAAAKLLVDKGAQAVAIIFINAYANADNERRALAAVARGLAERACHRFARGAVRDPRVRALLDRGAQRLSAAGRRRPISASSRQRWRSRASAASSTSCSRTAASCRPRPRAGCRCARRCPARPPAWSRARRIAKAAGFDNLITCDLGGTSFDVSVDRRRQGRARGADHDRLRPGDPHADDRDHHHRRGRRLDRLGRSRRAAAGRAGKRGLGAGAGLLRPGQRRGRR